MTRRNVQLDHKGKRRNPLSDAGLVYRLVRFAAPTMPHSCAAHVVALYGDSIMHMEDEEMRATLEAARRAWETATERERTTAEQRANKWESNPETQSHLTLFGNRGKTAAFGERDAWIARVKRRGTKAERAEDYGAALRSDELLVKHVPMEGLLSGRDMPAPQGNTNNFFGPTLFAGWTDGELAAYIAKERAAIAEGKAIDDDDR